MKKIMFFLGLFFINLSIIQANQVVNEIALPTQAQELSTSEQASTGAELLATSSATFVDPIVKQSIQEKRSQDLTEVTGSKTDALTTVLLEKNIGTPNLFNFLQVSIRQAVNRGLPTNLIVLLILFPLVASLIAFSRHVLGLRGFGIYTPAVLSVALVSTGIKLGISVFLVIVIASIILQKLMKKINLAHLPKSSLVLWGVCTSMIAFLIAMAYFKMTNFFSLTIFPLLILISLSENFTSTQLFSTTKEAAKLTIETLFLGIIAALIIGNEALQKFVILNPEMSLLMTFGLNWLIGRYNGLRLMELIRFKDLIKKD